MTTMSPPICLSVCMRCKPSAWSGDDDRRPGAVLAEEIDRRCVADGVCDIVLREIRCMSQCNRPCVAALSCDGKFTSLFGDLAPQRDVEALFEAVNLYRMRRDGVDGPLRATACTPRRYPRADSSARIGVRPRASTGLSLKTCSPRLGVTPAFDRTAHRGISAGKIATLERPAAMDSRQILRRALLAGAVALTTLVLPSMTYAQQGDALLRVVAPWEYTSNDPTDTGYILARMGIADTLVQVEPDGKLIGGVASSWTIDADKLTWRFALRPGATFHDGSQITASAVATSLKAAFAGESLSAVPFDGVAAEGEQVVIRTRTPFSVLPPFLTDYASVILAPSSYGSDGKVQKIVASGPYRIAAIDGKTILDLERFDGYARTKPAIAKVRYTAVGNGNTRANIAVAGDADLVFTVAPTAISRIDAAGQMKVESVTIPRIRPIAFNSGLAQFEDVRVRRAISMAIDRAGIASAILRHPGSAATQLLPPLMKDWHDPSLPPIAYDVEGAKKLLAEAGWVPEADGIRAKGGVRLAARMLTLSGRAELPVMATAIQAQLRQIGMEIAIEAGQAAIIPAAIKDGTMQMTMFARTYVNVPEVIATIIPDYTRERSTWGTMNWPGRDRIRPLTEEYVTSFDDARKAALRREIMKIIHDEAPVIPVSWFEHTVAVSKRVTGVEIDPYEMRYLIDRVRFR